MLCPSVLVHGRPCRVAHIELHACPLFHAARFLGIYGIYSQHILQVFHSALDKMADARMREVADASVYRRGVRRSVCSEYCARSQDQHLGLDNEQKSEVSGLSLQEIL